MRRTTRFGHNPNGHAVRPVAGPPSFQAFRAAALLHRQGRLPEAEQFYKAQLKQTPNHFDTLHSLALVSAQRGDLEGARRLVRKALNQKPRAVEAYNSLGYILQAQGRYQEAVAAYRKAIGINPDYAVAYNNLGNALLGCQRHEEAVENYRMAIAKKADFAEAYKNLGGTLLALDRYEEAIACNEEALAIQPDLAGAHFHRGVALETIGRLDEARSSYEMAVKFAPQSGRFHHSLAESKRYRIDDPHLAEMEVLACEMASLPEEERMCLHFGLGKALMDIGQHERAFNHFLKGNALKRRRVVYDEKETLATFGRIRSVFTSELMQRHRNCGYPSSIPIFILGMPRSGTTLLEQMLASHPNVFGAGERPDFEQAVASCGRDQFDKALGYPNCIDSLNDQGLQLLGATYVNSITATAPDSQRITDKLPGNFRFVGLIHLALPKARIIHTRRNPIDTCISCFTKMFSGDLSYTYELTELGKYYRAYEQLMAHWRDILPEGVMLEVDYEELVADFEGQARRVVAYCGLKWDPRCLAFNETQRPVRTASASQVRQPIYNTSVGRWRSFGQFLDPLIGAIQCDRSRV